ncbi:hypothetical protein FACS1894201_10870 [Bacteroidia bacterium]|nr:hypothetical protein FACS1894201_10870 [Bacteroidia bacterium]
MKPIRLLLIPFVPFYAVVVWIRNLLFNYNILASQKIKRPSICIGNIVTGGSGKTPHTKYLIQLLSRDFRIGVISRGYKRKTKNLVFYAWSW